MADEIDVNVTLKNVTEAAGTTIKALNEQLNVTLKSLTEAGTTTKALSDQLNVTLENLTEAGTTMKALIKQLTDPKELEMELLHQKLLKWRASIKKLEQEPDRCLREMLMDDEETCNFDKLYKVLNNPDEYYCCGYDDFTESVFAMTDECPHTSAELLYQMFGILNNHIHTYEKHRRIDQPLFKDERLIKIAECLDKVDISES